MVFQGQNDDNVMNLRHFYRKSEIRKSRTNGGSREADGGPTPLLMPARVNHDRDPLSITIDRGSLSPLTLASLVGERIVALVSEIVAGGFQLLEGIVGIGQLLPFLLVGVPDGTDGV